MQLSKALEGYSIASLAEGYSQLTQIAYQSALVVFIITYCLTGSTFGTLVIAVLGGCLLIAAQDRQITAAWIKLR